MKTLINWLIIHLLLGGTLFFAAGAPPLTDAGSGDAGSDAGDAGAGDDLGYGSDAGDENDAAGDAADDSADDGAADDDTQDPELRQKAQDDKKDEFGAYKGLASSRVRGLIKAAPELSQVFQKYPKIQEQLEATFRRDAGYREVFPTLAEANQMREQFPNGLTDVQQLLSDVNEVETLDKDLYTRDAEGNFPGHAKVVSNIFQDDPKAAVALFRNLPKEWARLDRESYNEVMGNIVGATLQARGIPEFLSEMIEEAKTNKQDGMVKGLTSLLQWANGFSAEKPKPSPEQERLSKDRAAFDRQTQERTKEEGTRFHNNFLTQSRKLQTEIISKHPAIARLEKVQGITPEKRQRIVEEVRKKIEGLLGKSPSFMRKLRPAYDSRNLDETVKLQKAAWSQQWLLNKMIRDVLRVETPAMVKNNRDATRRAGAPANKKPGTGERKDASPKGNVQLGGRWYRDGGKGAPFTVSEVLSGKHLL